MKNFYVQKILNKIAKPMLTVKVELFINDKLVKKFFGESVTANFLAFQHGHFSGDDLNFAAGVGYGRRNAKKRSGGAVAINLTVPSLITSVSCDWRGIIFGVGTTAPLPALVDLVTPIRHGIGAGLLSYGYQGSVKDTTILGSATDFVLSRSAQNLSGATITVTELGIFAEGSSFAANDSFLLYYDSPVNVPILNNETLSCQITFAITT